MAENANIRVRTRYKADTDYIGDINERLTLLQEKLNDMAISDPTNLSINNDSKTITLKDTGYSSSTVFEERDNPDFEPQRIDWDELIELYGDDPALVFIFGQLKGHFAAPGHRFQFYSDGTRSTSSTTDPVGTGSTTTWPTTYTTSTSDTVSVSDPVTISYDASGVVNVVYTKE